MRIAILTTKDQWFQMYAVNFSKKIGASLFYDYATIKGYDIVFILGFHTIIPEEILTKNKHNIVIHESALPKGKGWAPIFWQVLEGKNKIPVTMFEATKGTDNGPIYMQRTLTLTGFELNAELRQKQAEFTIAMCLEFIDNYQQYKEPIDQIGEETFYPKRSAKDSKLDINRTIKEQFNLLRIVNNNEYPAFFEIDGHKYIIKIEESDENR